MLFLLFHLGKHRYALEAKRVVEVLPLLKISPLPCVPRGVAGVFNYRGRPIPAVDLCELTRGQPAEGRMSTRIIVVQYPDAKGQNRLLGLVAERATETLRREPGEFHEAEMAFPDAPYLGPVLLEASGPVQWLQERRLLPESVRDLLFAATTEANDGRD